MTQSTISQVSDLYFETGFDTLNKLISFVFCKVRLPEIDEQVK